MTLQIFDTGSETVDRELETGYKLLPEVTIDFKSLNCFK
jgi:hypothetical protein